MFGYDLLSTIVSDRVFFRHFCRSRILLVVTLFLRQRMKEREGIRFRKGEEGLASVEVDKYRVDSYE